MSRAGDAGARCPCLTRCASRRKQRGVRRTAVPRARHPHQQEVSLSPESTMFITADALLAHWQGHRRLTRRVIDAFPDDKLFTLFRRRHAALRRARAGDAHDGRPDGAAAPSREWSTSGSREPRPKQEVLRLWDERTDSSTPLWPQIPPPRFQETLTAFGHVPGRPARPHPLRHRQRDPSPRTGLRLPARARHRAAAVLRSPLMAESV